MGSKEQTNKNISSTYFPFNEIYNLNLSLEEYHGVDGVMVSKLD